VGTEGVECCGQAGPKKELKTENAGDYFLHRRRKKGKNPLRTQKWSRRYFSLLTSIKRRKKKKKRGRGGGLKGTDLPGASAVTDHYRTKKGEERKGASPAKGNILQTF